MYKADSARAVSPKSGLEKYLSARIKDSAEGGFKSTKCWIDSSDLDTAAAVLEEAGYGWEQVQTDDKRCQIIVSW